MTTGVALLDEAPPPTEELRRQTWFDDVERSLSRHPREWLSAVQQESLTKDRAWTLLNWVEDAASRVATENRSDRVVTSASALSLLEASPLDRRDVMVVASLVRRAAEVAGFDYPGLIRQGCALTGDLGEQCLQWLWWASSQVPVTHEEVGTGSRIHFRRKPTDIDVGALERWLDGSS